MEVQTEIKKSKEVAAHCSHQTHLIDFVSAHNVRQRARGCMELSGASRSSHRLEKST
jgi:hypothetical protein